MSEAPRSKISPERPSRRRLRVLLGSGGAAIVVGVALWFLAIPYPWTLRTRDPERTSLQQQRVDEARAEGTDYELRQQWLPLEDISPDLVRAVLVAEDYRFRQHAGVDWVSLAEEVRWTGDEQFAWWRPSDLGALADALGYAWSHREELRGRSTITQQLAKNLYFGTDRSATRKALEVVVAGRLERRLGKDRILELYLNVAEWGPGIFGAEAAARAYFGRSASELTLDQAAALAGTLPHPLTSNPRSNPGRMLWRKNLILQRLDPHRSLPPRPMPPDDFLPEVESPSPDGDPGVPPEPALEAPIGPQELFELV
jgi:monofunctional biosynthetic peptidoglycan transglycosylase